jgi:transcriptional regulator with XRE-family HTH domain
MSNLQNYSDTLIFMSKPSDWSTLRGRVRWVIDTERVKSAKWWSEQAGQSRGYVGRMTREDLSPTVDTLEKMAEVADVPLAWLRYGEGQPGVQIEGVKLDPEDPYPTRGPVIAMAIKEGVPEGAIAALLAERKYGGDPGEEYWRKRLREQILEAKQLRRLLDRLVEDDDTFGKDEST